MTYGQVEVQLHSFFTSALEECRYLASCPGYFTSMTPWIWGKVGPKPVKMLCRKAQSSCQVLTHNSSVVPPVDQPLKWLCSPSICMCVCINIWIYIYIYIYIYTHTHTHTHTYIYTHTHAHCVCVCVCVCVYVGVCQRPIVVYSHTDSELSKLGMWNVCV